MVAASEDEVNRTVDLSFNVSRKLLHLQKHNKTDCFPFDLQLAVPLGSPQIEDIVTRIQDEKAGGVSIRTVKSFLSKIPSVVSGQCRHAWAHVTQTLSVCGPVCV